MTIPTDAQKGNTTGFKINIPARNELRHYHIQPGINGLGESSVFSRELHKVVPELYRRRWS